MHGESETTARCAGVLPRARPKGRQHWRKNRGGSDDGGAEAGPGQESDRGALGETETESGEIGSVPVISFKGLSTAAVCFVLACGLLLVGLAFSDAIRAIAERLRTSNRRK